jgi:plastocyanin
MRRQRATNKEATMSLKTEFRCTRRSIAIAFAAGALTALGAAMALAAPDYMISQKGREFHPGEITIKRGDTLKIVNDDADLLHHAYIDSPTFSFDSGDQTPGSVTPITFTVPGNFNVLCAIHPKMLLVVHVQ